jgi:hypothetical protein
VHGRIALALLAGAIACGDGTGPSRSVGGTWELVSFIDHGVVGVTTGTMVFETSGRFEVLGTVTYPGEPTDSLNVTGTWLLALGRVTLTSGGTSGDWGLRWKVRS